MTLPRSVVYGHTGPLRTKLADQLTRAGVAFEIIEPAAGTAEQLARRFAGATVVHNTSGPFAVSGHHAVEAALLAACHYLDTSDENDWLVKAREVWHDKYDAAGLLLAPGLAQPFATSEIAANLALDTPGAESLDVLVLWRNMSASSSAAQLQRLVEHHGLDPADSLSWPLDRVLNVRLPGHPEPGMAIRFDESPHATWFEDDERVTELRTYGGASERSKLASLTSCAGPTVAEGRSALALGQPVDPTIDSVYAQGYAGRTHVLLVGTCPYDETAILHTRAARSLIDHGAAVSGFTSGCRAFGHLVLLEALESAGVVEAPLVTVEA
ncbi:DUF5938 domain-containing protein [Nocardioides jensenii]|uniref:DUF5938 domain-containing protein n=1 Tax=Nocardioides jensenii TaxID=1843 RepID=UPI000AB9D31E|nr:DUF5938 domain-containing protein [Nocardioides jensenii]